MGHEVYSVVVKIRVTRLVCTGNTLHEAIVQVHIAKDEMITAFCYLLIRWNIGQVSVTCLCHSEQCHPNIVQLMGIHFSQHSQHTC